MKFEESLIHLREGKKITRECWVIGSYIFLDDDMLRDDVGDPCSLDFIELTEDIWHLYEEEKTDEEIESQDMQNIFLRLNELEGRFVNHCDSLDEKYLVNFSIRNYVDERLNVVEKLVRDQSIGTHNVYQEFCSMKGQMEILASLINSPHKEELLQLYKKFQKLKELDNDEEWFGKPEESARNT